MNKKKFTIEKAQEILRPEHLLKIKGGSNSGSGSNNTDDDDTNDECDRRRRRTNG